MRLFWAPGAVEDLRQLRAYIAQDNPRAAADIAAKVLEAVYAGRHEEIAADLKRMRTRKAAMQEQISAIDGEILALILAD